MQTRLIKYWLLGLALVIFTLVMGLWSWNTLAELFDLPSAGFKHALAAAVVLWILRWRLARDRPAHLLRRSSHHG